MSVVVRDHPDNKFPIVARYSELGESRIELFLNMLVAALERKHITRLNWAAALRASDWQRFFDDLRQPGVIVGTTHFDALIRYGIAFMAQSPSGTEVAWAIETRMNNIKQLRQDLAEELSRQTVH